MKTAICIIARTFSSRLPQKVLIKINGLSIIEHIIKNLERRRNKSSELVICTTFGKEDDILEKIADSYNLKNIRGSVLSVSDRMLSAAQLLNADTLIRVTADNIFTDVFFLDELLDQHERNNAEYSRVMNLPMGTTCEIINRDTLEKCYKENDKNTSEYMTVHLFNPKKYKTLVIVPEESLTKSKMNLSIDTKDDLNRTHLIFQSASNPFNLLDVITTIAKFHIPYSYFNTDRSIKLIDKTVTYSEYEKLLLKYSQMSVNITLPDNWYNKKINEY